MKRLLLAVPLALAGCSTSGTGTDAASDELLARARSLVQEGNLDDALLITDQLLAADPRNREARLLAADANVALALSGRANAQAFLLDAEQNLEAVVGAHPDDADAWLRLADVRLKNAQFDRGRDAALRAAKVLRERKASVAEISAAVLAAADNEMQLFVEARRPELENEEPPSENSMARAQAVLSRLSVARQGAPGKAAVRIARVYQWLGQHDSALAELERGIQADPTEPEVHIAFQDFMLASDKRAELVAAYKRLHSESGDHPTILFYLGRAQYCAADGLRSRGQWQEAAAAYERAKEAFGRYLAARPDHASTATHWQAMCDLSRGRIALDRGDHAAAKAAYYAAYDTDPRVLQRGPDGMVAIVDSFGGTYAGGLFMLGTALAEGSTEESLRAALAFFEEVIARHPDAIGQFYNNAGLAARDLGAAVAQRDEQEAMALWERSYQHYCKAVELVPDDPRIVNDCGLMLVYHLKRDYDKAQAMFERAIELGEVQLRDLPDDASDDERNFLEEAVGDAWQNLAVMARQQGKPFAEYRAFLEKAVQYYPGQRRTAAELLRTEGATAVGLPGGTAPSVTPEERRQREALRDAAAAAEAAAAAGDYDGALAELEKHRAELGDLPPFQALVARYTRDRELRGAFAAVESKARAAMAENDYDAALLALDEQARALDGYAPFHALVGQCSLLYAEQARSSGGSAGQVDGLYADALNHLGRARELDGESSPTRFALAQALFATGRFAEARDEAASLLSHVRSVGHAGGVDLLEVHRLRAEASARTYIEAKQAGGEDEAALRGARESMRVLADAGKLGGKTLQTWIGLEQWAGAPGQALEVALGALADPAAPGEVLDQAITLAGQLGQSDKVVAALADGTDPLRRWYLGRARFQRAQELWADDVDAALAELDAARTAFAEAKDGNPSYADSSDQWIALAHGSRGVMLLAANRLAEAEAALLESLRLRPDCAARDLGGGNSTKRALLVLGSKYQNDLEKFEALMRTATEAVPDDVDFANNHGLAARDLGNRVERTGDAARARALYEASYASYVRAARLEPDNVRLRNDCALMLLYHLHRDLDDAVRMLEEARDDGLRRLRDDPPATAQERQDLEEAVGDCIENLGYFCEVHAKDPEKAIPHYKQSLEFHPRQQRAAARRLRALERRGSGADR